MERTLPKETRKRKASQRRVALILGIAVACIVGVVISVTTRPTAAAVPNSGTLTTINGPLVYTSGPFAVSNPTDQVNGVPTCDGTLPCDDYTLTVNVPGGYDAANYVRIQVSWPHQTTLAQYDIFVYKVVTPANNPPGPLMAANFFAVDPDVVTIPAVSGTYLLRIAPTIAQGDITTTKISLEQKVAAAITGSGLAPRFQTYQAPGSLGSSAGEPSLGVGLATNQFPQGRTMYQASTTALRVSFDDCPSPANTLWENKSAPNSTGSLDPILFTDRITGRTFTSQLAGACSKAAYTDTASPFNDGDTWVPSQGCGVPAGVDHQTFGGGPLAPPLTGNPSFPAYPNGVYYCSQYGTNAAACAISLDGGLTFGPAVPIYQVSCFGIHGHVKVAPDGTAYVPNSDCSTSFSGPGPTDTAHQGLVFSEDNGATWSQPQLVPDSNPAPGIVDPSIGIGSGGTIYYGYANSNGAPSIAVGHKNNHQIVWGPSKDVGSALGVQNSTFPEVVAGDDNRAAFAFLGTTTSGYYQDPEDFQGVWHLYIATTYDGGATWTTVDATPTDPVQLGSICNSGTVICDRAPNDRNLLDFMDITLDRFGKIQVAFPDGCITLPCIQIQDRSGHTAGTPDGKINRYDNDNARKASIARQSGGRALFSAFDPSPTEPLVPKAPNVVSATRDGSGVHLEWLQPDNGGAAITGYNILRGTTSGGETLLATVNPVANYDITLTANRLIYQDSSVDPSTTYYYKISANNSVGTGPSCGEFQLAAAASPTPTPTPTPTPAPTPTPVSVQFSMASYMIPEGVTQVPITVTRTGDVSGVSTVDYTVNNNTATQRGDFTYASGTVVFSSNEASKTFPVLISEDGYLEGTESATMTLTNATGATVGTPGTAILQIVDNDATDSATNPIDDAATFVGQHYHDFLNRQADADGQTFWTNQITSCGNDASCLDEKRNNVSAAFFLSVEFQNTGYFAFRFYRASFPDSAQRPRGVPRYLEFLRDEQTLQRNVVVGQANWEAVLEQNKQGFALDWMDRSDFQAEYPLSLTRDEYIDRLFSRSGATPTTQERNQALFAYDSGGSLKEKRAKGIRAVIDTGSVYNAQYNPAFVLMQYFGYLRRNPNNAPDSTYAGYDFWLKKMNDFSVPGEDVRDANVALAREKRADMVKAFLVSAEYRGRFGGDSSRGQQAGPITEPPPEAVWRSVTSLRAIAVALRKGLFPSFTEIRSS